MKRIPQIFFLFGAIAILAACGGGNTLENKKKEIEKLKAEQADINSRIKTLEEEIAAIGDTVKTNDRTKVVAITPINPTLFEHYIDVQGRVDGDENTTISARAMGPVVKVYVKTGMQVKAGQLLAELDGEIVKTQIADLKLNWNFVNDVYNKQKAMWEKQVGSEMQYLTAKNNKENLEQKLATLNEQLDMYRIKSPINGAIDEVFIKIGQSVTPGMPCFRVVNFNNLKVKADVAETYAQAIKEGNEVVLMFPDINNREIRSTISFTAKVINQMSRTFTIEAKLPADNSYIPNMITVLKVIDYKSANAIVVPVNTVQNSEGKTHVFVLVNKDGKSLAEKREVVVGRTYNDKAEILSGINKGDLLITTGYQDLNNNEVIKY
ncbi:MAG: efflux RND transporter periplasmic adaptor subunit [Bacteroidota bacterium]|nr:efflux RND transporter periplasmic adaptor subunit [Bacteroidota bacterium]